VIWLQRTVGKAVSIEGVGLHTGETTRLTFSPAAPNTGLVFRVRQNGRQAEIPALVENLAPADASRRNTTLVKGEVTVATVEHVLASLVGLGVTNCYLDLEGREPPVVGCASALPYVRMLEEAGVVPQGLPASCLHISSPVEVRHGDAQVGAEACDHFRITFQVDYQDSFIGRQEASFEIRPDTFAKQLAPARTFAFLEDVHKLREMGLAQGGSLETALVISNGRLADGQTLRFPDEFVRHKILDLLGDVALLGMPIQGHLRAYRSGHVTNALLTKALDRLARNGGRVAPPRGSTGFDIGSILDIMPHRYPFLLVDRILEMEPDRRVLALKNVTINEPFFQGHFPGHPIMPGVLIIEAMAQAGGLLLLTSVANPVGKLVYFTGIDAARFRRPVVPGDQLLLECELIKLRGAICKMRGTAKVAGEKVAEAELMAKLVEA
jgi:UDP-3-O-[3-hydroxymyristoyl] N-acetylglucosamine deacetylase / 3-hydroxyacyl-[acyl-carrier-protein] dehydratase